MEYRFEQGNFADARIVRTRVFMEEQGFANEFDSLDEHPATLHVTLYDAEGALAGCARTFPDPEHPDEMCIRDRCCRSSSRRRPAWPRCPCPSWARWRTRWASRPTLSLIHICGRSMAQVL